MYSLTINFDTKEALLEYLRGDTATVLGHAVEVVGGSPAGPSTEAVPTPEPVDTRGWEPEEGPSCEELADQIRALVRANLDLGPKVVEACDGTPIRTLIEDGNHAKLRAALTTLQGEKN